MLFISGILFVLCLAFPLFHTANAFFGSRKMPYYMKTKIKEEKGMSILIPCYNEEAILNTSIKGMESLQYQNYEIIYVNDGSTDNTLEVLVELLDLFEEMVIVPFHELEFMHVKKVYRSNHYPNVKVIDKVNGGKADSLNAGIALASKDIVITLDADSILEANSLYILNQAFADPDVISAGGNVHILQGQEMKGNSYVPAFKKNIKHIVRFQILEYLRGFYILKSSLARSNALSIISGAFGAFKRDALLSVGGYRKTIGEDIDITLKIQQYAMKKRRAKILFIPESICYTEVPETWRDLFNQRIRWQKAFIDCMFLYCKTFLKSILINKVAFFFIVDSFIVGVVASYFTGFFIISLLVALTSLTIDLFLFYIVISLAINLLYTLVSFQSASSYGHTYRKCDYLNLFVTVVLDLLFFRFINLLLIMIGSLAYFVNKHDWNKVARTGRVYQMKKAS